MRLLLVTQIVDSEDPVLGFFVRWIETISEHVESVDVICLKNGAHNLPKNVTVHSLGKERHLHGGGTLWSRLKYALRFYRILFSLRSSYDSVFVHMNPEYILLAGWYWKMADKRVGLWYVHRSRPWYLRAALRFTNVVFTASAESFCIPTKKLRVMGHGIDVTKYAKVRRADPGSMRIVTTGRIAPAKRIREMVESVTLLSIPFDFAIYGAPATKADKLYEHELVAHVAGLPYASQIHLMGAIPHTRVPEALSNRSVFLNLSRTESMDKAVLEALAAGIPVVTTNPAFRDMLEPYGLYIAQYSPDTVARAIEASAQIEVTSLQHEVLRDHSLARLIPAMLDILNHD